MARTAILAIKIISDATNAARGVGKAEQATSRFARANEKAKRAARGTLGGIALLGGAALKQASDLQQAAGAVDSVFGRQSGKIHKLAREAAGSVGLARSEYSNLAAVLGSQLGNLGVAQDQLVGKTDSLVKLGGDLAATFGGTTADAVSALSALLRGETDPVERYGVSIKQADIAARLAAKGQDKLTGKQLQAAKTQATLELLNRQTAKAQGQRAREAGSEAQAREVAMARLKNAGATLGSVLLPIAAAIATQLGRVAGVVENNRTAFVALIGVAGALAATVYAVNGAIAAYTAVSKVARAAVIVFRNAQLALNIAMSANPIGVVIALVIALVAGIVLAYKKSKTFRNIVDGAMRAAGRAVKGVVGWVRDLVTWVRTNAPRAASVLKTAFITYLRLATAPIRTAVGVVRSLYGWIRTNLPAAVSWAKTKAVNAFSAMTSPLRTVLGYVKDIVDWIRRIKIPSLGGLGRAVGGVFGFSSAGGTTAARSLVAPTTARSLVGARSLTSSTSSRRSGGDAGAGVVIHVNGALDPDAVAKQIAKMLGRRNVRLSGATP